MQTQHGGRFGLRLVDAAPDCARYTLTLSTSDAEWWASVQVSASDGSLSVDAWQGQGAPPAWLEQYARAALRDAWRGHADRGWPRRIQRWRAPPSVRAASPREDSE